MERPRDAAFDIVKGISVIEVILHHWSSHSARKYTVEGSIEWWVLMLTNRVLHFAVPVFLFITALLLVRSLANKDPRDVGAFYKRRAVRALWPYLVWTLAYVLFRLFVVRVGSDVEITSVTYPLVGALQGPNVLVSLEEWRENLLWGRGYYHLYFMSVLLQLSLVLPLIPLLIRKVGSLSNALLLSALLQLAIYLLQAYLLRVSSPASTIFWYTVPITAGAWCGANWEMAKGYLSRWQLPALACAAGLGVYLWLSIRLFLGLPISTILYNSGMTVYSVGAAFLLLSAGRSLTDTKIGKRLARVGSVSIALFLVHPMLLYLLSGPRITAWFMSTPWPALTCLAVLLVLVTTFVWAARRLKLDLPLFGQRFQDPPVAKPVAIAPAG